MAELFEEVVSLLESRSSTRALAGQFRIESEQAASNGAVLGVPVFLAGLNEWANDSVKSVALLKTLRSIDTSGLQDPGAAVEAKRYDPIGTELTNMILGARRNKVASVISAEAGISEPSANGLLAPTAWAVMASIADRYGSRIDRQSLISILSREQTDLIDGGWGPWLDATGDDGLVESEPAFSQHSVSSAPVTIADQPGSYPPPVNRHARATEREPVAAAQRPMTRPMEHRQAALAGSVDQRRPTTRPGAEPIREEDPPNRLPAILGVLLLFLLGAAAIFWLMNNRSDSDTATGTDLEADGSGTGADADEQTGDAEENDVAQDPTAQSDGVDLTGSPIALDIMMDDPQGRSESTGLAELRFDVESGEICYNVNASLINSPYDGHIHVGGLGVKGGIVVDFGPLNNSDIGCTEVNAAEMANILNDQSGHYVEMHDPIEDFTIRAQLSEAINDPSGSDGGSEVAADALFDPDGGGALTRIESGRIIMRGEVADQETFDRLAGEFTRYRGCRS